MSGMKSGQGDDMWEDDEDGDVEDEDGDDVAGDEPTSEEATDADVDADSTASGGRGTIADVDDGPEPPAAGASTTDNTRPYIVRRSLKDKDIKFERDETLTFFVHDEIAEREKDLVVDMEKRLGRDVPVTDVREAVYRAALENQDDILTELLEMGYTVE